ncbi:MAG: glycosyltransferase family 2 protein [Crocinitomicaceae bacterium]|nr:glycosyltransferase family 2 protein [Crocinitomicaceae bacterium]
MNSEISVVILNYNGEKHLQNYLSEVVKYSPEAQVVIIDNASTDNSINYIEENYPEIQLIKLEKNIGFAKGYNKGLKFVKSTYYILLNNDVRVSKNWISPLIEGMKKKEVAGCQPKILSDRDSRYFEHAGASGGFMDTDFFPFCRGRIFDSIEKDKHQYNQELDVFWVSGAAFAIKAEIFNEVNGFDERFFAHMEEIDLCWRAQNLGFKFKAIPSSVVYHYGGGTLGYESSSKIYLNFRNNLFMIFKNYKGFIAPKLFRRMSLDFLAAFKFLVSGKFTFFFSVFLAHIDFYRNVPSLLKQRKKLPKKRKNELIGLYKKSILASYFIKKKRNFNELKF